MTVKVTSAGAKVENPLTGRLILATGALAKKLRKQGVLPPLEPAPAEEKAPAPAVKVVAKRVKKSKTKKAAKATKAAKAAPTASGIAPTASGIAIKNINANTEVAPEDVETVAYEPGRPYSAKAVYHVTSRGKAFKFRKKQAIFDLDHTLTRPRNKSRFAKSVDDWEWMHPSVPGALREVHKNGYSVVIMTNKSKGFTGDMLQDVADYLAAKAKTPVRAYFTKNRALRKPNTAMYDAHVRLCEEAGVEIDPRLSYMVGDALGRAGDWSDADAAFARAAGLPVRSPEEAFPELKGDADEGAHAPDAKTFRTKAELAAILRPLEGGGNVGDGGGGRELVVLVGYPGSGKTTLSEVFEDAGYLVIHGDEYKSNKSRMRKAVVAEFDKGDGASPQGRSVVVDATNPARERRAYYIDAARKAAFPPDAVRIVHMATSFEQSMAQNAGRERKVPAIALYTFRKNFEAPTEKGDGVDEVVTVLRKTED